MARDRGLSGWDVRSALDVAEDRAAAQAEARRKWGKE
jgi:hypothetical protein